MKPISSKIIFIITLLCLIGIGMFYRIHKNKQQAELKKTLIYDFLAKPSGIQPVKTYRDSSTLLWSDRSYHTQQSISEIANYNYFQFPRNDKSQVIINCTKDCMVFTLANSEAYINLNGWEYVRSIYVHDVSAPRAFDSLYRKRLEKGVYILNNHLLRPSLTLFFPPDCIEILN